MQIILKSLLSAILFSLVLLSAGNSKASDNQLSWYLGVDFGASLYNFPSEDSGSGTTWAINGGYELTPNWALEVGYKSLGTATIQSISFGLDISTNAFYINGLGIYPLTNKWDIFAVVGVNFANSNSTARVLTLDDNFMLTDLIIGGDESATEFVYGLGVKYQLTDRLGIRLSYNVNDNINFDEDVDIDIDTISIGLQIQF